LATKTNKHCSLVPFGLEWEKILKYKKIIIIMSNSKCTAKQTINHIKWKKMFLVCFFCNLP
jgi:hypothetical protein